MKQLLELWDGSYKAGTLLGNVNSKHSEAYVLSRAALQEMDRMVRRSNNLIPSKMCGTVTAVSARWRWTAETHLFFLITLGPIILKPFLPAIYFDHFLDLSESAKVMISLSIDLNSDLEFLRDGLRRWVARFDE